MPHPAHHPLLHRPGIRPDAQHFDIVIGFHDQHIAAPQVIAHTHGNIAKIGGKADFDAFGAKGKSHRIGGIVREW